MSLHSEEDQNSRKKQQKNTRLPIPSTLRSQWQHKKEKEEELLSDSPLEIGMSNF